MFRGIKNFFKIKFAKYDNNLIRELQEEHKKLLNSFLEIEQSLIEGYKHKPLFLLKFFKQEFLEHIKKEDNKLYPYLKKHTKNKDEIIKKEKEMEQILQTLEEELFSHDNTSKILENMKKLKEHLLKRIKEEETTLFKEYLKNYKI